VSEFVFITCNVLDVDRSRSRGIAHGLNQTRHLPFKPQMIQKASDCFKSQP
jgi:hypothetical protein